MSNDSEVLLKFMEEQWTQARQSENQRSTMANFIISIYTVGVGFIVANDFALNTLPLAIFLVLLGVFGAIFSMKLFERWRLHERRAIKWSEQIDKMNPGAKILELFWEAHKEHKTNHPTLYRIRLYRLWASFFLLLTAFIVALSLYIFVKNGVF